MFWNVSKDNVVFCVELSGIIKTKAFLMKLDYRRKREEKIRYTFNFHQGPSPSNISDFSVSPCRDMRYTYIQIHTRADDATTPRENVGCVVATANPPGICNGKTNGGNRGDGRATKTSTRRVLSVYRMRGWKKKSTASVMSE